MLKYNQNLYFRLVFFIVSWFVGIEVISLIQQKLISGFFLILILVCQIFNLEEQQWLVLIILVIYNFVWLVFIDFLIGMLVNKVLQDCVFFFMVDGLKICVLRFTNINYDFIRDFVCVIFY